MTTTNARVAAMAEGRRADTARRRQRVIKALNDNAAHGEDLTVAAIARTAGVDRTFLYRHRDLLGQVHAMAAQLPTSGNSMTPSRASLQADLLAAQQRAIRLHTRVRQLEQRLSQLLGEQTWRESGLGAPDDIDEMKQRINHFEQQAIDLQIQLDERDQDLAAARAANRELMTQLNTQASTRTRVPQGRNPRAPHSLQ
jgi:chromosome segregation ATPase